MNNFSPLLFRRSDSELFLQNVYGKNSFVLAAPQKYLPSFLINLAEFGFTNTGDIHWYQGTSIGKFGLVNDNTGAVTTIEISGDEEGIVTIPERHLLFYNGIQIRDLATLPIGRYYLTAKVTQGSGSSMDSVTVRSEVFTIADTANYIEVDYFNSFNLIDPLLEIPFEEGWRPKLYLLSTGLSRPSYDYEEEVISRGGYSFVQKQVSKKGYRFSFYAPEYLCDAMRIIRLCDDVRIKWAGEEYRCDDFNMAISEWLDGEGFASVEVTFASGTVVVNVGNYIASNPGGEI